MVPAKTWSSRKNVIESICTGDSEFYRVGVDSPTHGVSFFQGNFRNLVSVLLQLPTKNKYMYEIISNLAQ